MTRIVAVADTDLPPISILGNLESDLERAYVPLVDIDDAVSEDVAYDPENDEMVRLVSIEAGLPYDKYVSENRPTAASAGFPPYQLVEKAVDVRTKTAVGCANILISLPGIEWDELPAAVKKWAKAIWVSTP